MSSGAQRQCDRTLGGGGDSSAICNFPPGHMLCMPCYKVIKRHASGIDTGYCAASHWSD